MCQFGKVMLVIIDVSECRIVPVIVLAGEQLHTARRGQWLGVHIHVLDTLRRQCVNVGSPVFRSAIAAEAFHPDIIREEENNVGLLPGLRRCASRH